jgi:hypothetical protein
MVSKMSRCNDTLSLTLHGQPYIPLAYESFIGFYYFIVFSQDSFDQTQKCIMSL